MRHGHFLFYGRRRGGLEEEEQASQLAGALGLDTKAIYHWQQGTRRALPGRALILPGAPTLSEQPSCPSIPICLTQTPGHNPGSAQQGLGLRLGLCRLDLNLAAGNSQGGMQSLSLSAFPSLPGGLCWGQGVGVTKPSHFCKPVHVLTSFPFLFFPFFLSPSLPCPSLFLSF